MLTNKIFNASALSMQIKVLALDLPPAPSPKLKTRFLRIAQIQGCPPIVYLRKQDLSRKILKNNRTGMLSELPTEERRKPTTTS